MKAIMFNEIDCKTLAEVLRGKVEVVEIEDLSWKVPHVGYGGATKSKYVSPNSGKTIYVLEQSGMYAADAFVNLVWQFEEDFTVEEAEAFIALFEREKNAVAIDEEIKHCLKMIEETKAKKGQKEEFFGIETIHDGDTSRYEKRLDLLRRMKTIQAEQ